MSTKVDPTQYDVLFMLRESATVQDLVCHATSIMKLQLGSRTTDRTPTSGQWRNRTRNNGLKERNLNNIRASEPSSMPSSPRTGPRTPTNPTPMPIWHQQQPHTAQYHSPPWSMTKIDDAPYCKLFLGSICPTTRCPAIPPQL